VSEMSSNISPHIQTSTHSDVVNVVETYFKQLHIVHLEITHFVTLQPYSKMDSIRTQPIQRRSGFGTSLGMSLSGPVRAWT
jgi:hypothetical protein